jgi:hypothetical protein
MHVNISCLGVLPRDGHLGVVQGNESAFYSGGVRGIDAHDDRLALLEAAAARN